MEHIDELEREEQARQEKRYHKAVERFELDDIDQKILKLKVQYPDMKKKDIADYLKMHPTTIGIRMKKPAYLKALSEFNKTTGEWILDLGRHMFRRLKTLINDPDKSVALQALKIAAPLVMNHDHSGSVVREERITFRTTVQADGSLLQEAIKEEMLAQEKNPPKPEPINVIDL
jgi:hypothetical protein